MKSKNFLELFRELTGSLPFPWQEALFARFIEGEIPESVNLPTGLGKTSIVAIWLSALAIVPGKTPRRLVYVVNRRTVVDQTTAEAERLRAALNKAALAEVRGALASLCALPLPTPEAPPLAISTLRGQFADNGEWCADPTRPAVIVGTVDMIGSGLLFSRYTRGFKTRPLHAGFLGQDALIVHDEAHLEPSFQKLLESITNAQNAAADPRKLRIIELTATSRAANGDSAPPFTLTEADRENEIVQKRVNAVKRLSRKALGEGEKLDEKLVDLARQKSGERAVLVFTRSVETAVKVAAELDKGERNGKVATLTGTMRGKERDELVSQNAVFQRFLPEKDRAVDVTPTPGTVFLVATSAGEVGVNISADDLVCDLSTYESMAQRFGRVNRFGDGDDSEITVVHETRFDPSNPLEVRRERTLALLKQVGGSASPAALEELPASERAAAFSPEPHRRVATEIQFDAWSLTSIREPIAARPPVAPYLHGEAEWQPPETHLAWRDERDFQYVENPDAFLDDFPLKPAELLRDTTARIVKTLDALLKKRLLGAQGFPNAWLIADNGSVSSFKLSDFDAAAALTRLADATLILPASIGGLDAKGLLSANDDTAAEDVSAIIRHEEVRRDDLPDGAAKIVRAIEISDEAAEEPRFLLWCKPIAENAIGARADRASAETLADHTGLVAANAAAIAARCFPDKSALAVGKPDLRRCITIAARLHDLGKNRVQWQRNLGNLDYDSTKPETILAKSTPGMRMRNVAEHYRHEFGSLNDAACDAEFAALDDTERDIVLHIVAAHHGRARPHFPADEILDYASGSLEELASLATEVPRRFGRLQRRFGRWGLAWLESILRAADYAASAGIVVTGDAANFSSGHPGRDTGFRAPVRNAGNKIAPTATLAVNPANPGHYFACCGLFELADRLAAKGNTAEPALAWFEQDPATRQWRFHLANTPPLGDILGKITSAEIVADDQDEDEDSEIQEAPEEKGDNEEGDASAPPLIVGADFGLRLDWWTTASAKTSALKVWAGSMKVTRIARSMNYTIKHTLSKSPADSRNILFDARIAFEPPQDTLKKSVHKAMKKRAKDLEKASATKTEKELEAEKAKIAARYEKSVSKAKIRCEESLGDIANGEKVEPFYFDANRGPNAHSRDVGFSANDLKLETLASPAVELLTLVGLQRATPVPVRDTPRNFDYSIWTRPLAISPLPAAVYGLLPDNSRSILRFESWFRTGQRKHKAFLTARTISPR